MEVVPLLVIAASGLCAVSSSGDREFHFVYEMKNWTEAQSYCREKYTDLTTIESLEDVQILKDTVDLSKMGVIKKAWIGLHHGVYNWKWSLSGRSFYKDGETEFRRWASGQPNSYRSGEHCTAMYSIGKWHDYRCTTYFRPVCMKVTGTEVEFILISKGMIWTEAQSYCRTHYTDLASVRNTGDNQKVKDLIPKRAIVWIGLFRDPWMWSDGGSSSYRSWKPNEPNGEGEEKCALADAIDYRLEDWPCNTTIPFTCYRQHITSKQLIKVSLQKDDPSLDLSDPAVMEGILQQLKQRMKAQGLDEGIKLTWKKQPDGKVFHKEEEEETKKRNTKEKKEEL